MDEEEKNPQSKEKYLNNIGGNLGISLEDSYKASSVMCREFLEHHVKGYTLGLGRCCDHNPTFQSDVTILIFKRLLMNLLAEWIHSKALPEVYIVLIVSK
uniref:Uncharacterized protein n=1 Tax=Magallana gigas TaxID=29159 RepID=K1R843_MAGGI